MQYYTKERATSKFHAPLLCVSHVALPSQGAKTTASPSAPMHFFPTVLAICPFGSRCLRTWNAQETQCTQNTFWTRPPCNKKCPTMPHWTPNAVLTSHSRNRKGNPEWRCRWSCQSSRPSPAATAAAQDSKTTSAPSTSEAPALHTCPHALPQ